MLNKLKLMAHTFRVLQNRLQRLVIRGVSKYLYSILIVCLVDDVILRSKSNCYTWLEGSDLISRMVDFSVEKAAGDG